MMAKIMRDSLSELTRVLSQTVMREPSLAPDRVALDALNEALCGATVRQNFIAGAGRDYRVLLENTLAAGRESATSAVTAALADVGCQLTWTYHYAPRSGEEDLSGRIAFAELVGPDGPMTAPNSRVGFTLIAPETYYPLHAHPAIELYWVISGRAEWQTPDRYHLVPPGNFVLHRSNEPHAMRTSVEPLLALWGWSGDVDTPAFYL